MRPTEHDCDIRHEGRSYRLSIQVAGHLLMVLNDSGSSQWGCLTGIEESEPSDIGLICVPHLCWNCVDMEAVCCTPLSAGNLLAVEKWKAQKNQILTYMIIFMPVGVLAGCLWEW